MATDVTCLQCGKPFDTGVVANRFAGVCPSCLAKFAASDETDVEQSPGRADPTLQPPLKVGGTFHGLDVVELLGAGGMGIVYKARQPGLDRSVALKVLSPKLTSDRDFVARFNREAKAMAALNHPGIVQVFDYGQESDLCFLVMEFVDGVSLRDLMKDRSLAPEKALKVVPQICVALDYAHSKGVIHRDIKPENILVDHDGRVKLADFGLARVLARDAVGSHMTVTNVVMGTPGYMAPEQYQSMKVDHRADIYSLGAVFYEMLTGQIPVGRFEPPSSKVQIDVRLDDIVLKALAAEPERRYQRAGDVKTDVEACDAHYFLPASKAVHWPKNDPWMPWLLRLLLPALCFLGGVILAEACHMAVYGAKRKGSGFVAAGLIFVAGALFGIARYNARWGRPIPRWRWWAAAGYLGCGLVSFLMYTAIPVGGQGLAIFGPVEALAIAAAFVLCVVLWERRMMRSPAGGPMGDEHLPRAIQAPFRASTLAAAALAVVGISYAILFIAVIAEEGMKPFGPRTWQDGDAALWILLPLQALAVWLASKAIFRCEPRSGRLQAYAALFLSLPPVGIIVAWWHLRVTEQGAESSKPAPEAPAQARMSGLVLAALAFVSIGAVFTILAVFVLSGNRELRSSITLLGVVFLLLGLALSLGGFREIRQSQGKLRGSGLGLVAFLGSMLSILVIFVVTIMGAPLGRSGAWVAPGAYERLLEVRAPRGFEIVNEALSFSGPANPEARPLTREESLELVKLDLQPLDGVSATRHVETMTVRRLRHLASAEEVTVRLVQMSDEYGRRTGSSMSSRLGHYSDARRRFAVEIEAASRKDGDRAVNELAGYYREELERIERGGR